MQASGSGAGLGHQRAFGRKRGHSPDGSHHGSGSGFGWASRAGSLDKPPGLQVIILYAPLSL